MALPVIKTLAECVDFDKTVSAFAAQLRELPQQISLAAFAPHVLLRVYLATNPVIFAYAVSIALGAVFLVVSEVNGNYSQVDRCWSILPPLYFLHYAVYAHLVGQSTARTDLALAVVLTWGCRLTFNYNRRGGYQVGSEDYRWQVVKNYVGQPLFFIFNVIFISFAQSVLLCTMATPMYVLLLSSRVEPKLQPEDIGSAVVILALIAVTATADQQQWQYHQAKAQYKKTAKVPPGYTQEDLELGFNTTGLFRFSRHPNFACEQGVWAFLFLWSTQVTRTAVQRNWTVVAPILYLVLFQASTWLTELLSAQKYPEYKEYQRQVGMFVFSPLYKWRGLPAKELKVKGKKAQ